MANGSETARLGIGTSPQFDQWVAWRAKVGQLLGARILTDPRQRAHLIGSDGIDHTPAPTQAEIDAYTRRMEENCGRVFQGVLDSLPAPDGRIYTVQEIEDGLMLSTFINALR
ncbi:hypothetical protein HY950_02620 [Candidatus Gottesmanbacteria bacterium]|nr:hypothetical protein [Candidatus Gottesmanbacteria bacterium]